MFLKDSNLYKIQKIKFWEEFISRECNQNIFNEFLNLKIKSCKSVNKIIYKENVKILIIGEH